MSQYDPYDDLYPNARLTELPKYWNLEIYNVFHEYGSQNALKTIHTAVMKFCMDIVSDPHYLA